MATALPCGDSGSDSPSTLHAADVSISTEGHGGSGVSPAEAACRSLTLALNLTLVLPKEVQP